MNAKALHIIYTLVILLNPCQLLFVSVFLYKGNEYGDWSAIPFAPCLLVVLHWTIVPNFPYCSEHVQKFSHVTWNFQKFVDQRSAIYIQTANFIIILLMHFEWLCVCLN